MITEFDCQISLGETYQGDMTNKVVVIPKQSDERLRWNMTATIAISK